MSQSITRRSSKLNLFWISAVDAVVCPTQTLCWVAHRSLGAGSWPLMAQSCLPLRENCPQPLWVRWATLEPQVARRQWLADTGVWKDQVPCRRVGLLWIEIIHQSSLWGRVEASLQWRQPPCLPSLPSPHDSPPLSLRVLAQQITCTRIPQREFCFQRPPTWDSSHYVSLRLWDQRTAYSFFFPSFPKSMAGNCSLFYC